MAAEPITIEQSGAFVETFTIEPTRPGPLSGLTFAVKDIIDIAGKKTGCGNPDWLDSHPPAAANAVCVDQVLAAGARCLGKTVTDELAFSLNGENTFYGTPLNPRAPDRIPGGSSSGPASAVACGLVDFALGTDTGGSVRVPASNCGIFGMRPSHGVISVAGVNPLAPSFDTLGFFARSGDVLSRVASVLLACEIPSEVEIGSIHVISEAFALADPEVQAALREPVEALRKTFHGQIRDTSMRIIDGNEADSAFESWLATYCTIQWAEIWSCLGPWILDRNPRFGPRIQTNFELTRNLDRSTVIDAIRIREAYYRKINAFLGPNDLLCIPTAPALAPLKGSIGDDRTKGTYYPRALSLTSVAGIGRLPQVSVPVADVDGVPVGLSLVAGRGKDGLLLRFVNSLGVNSLSRE